MVEHGQIVVAMFSPFGNSICGVATARAARTNKVSHAVGWQRIIVIGKIALVRTAAFYGALFHLTKSAEAHTAFWDSALVHTKPTSDAALCLRGVFRKTIRLPATMVNPLDFRPKILKVGPDAIHAKAYDIGNGSAAFAALSAGAHAEVVVIKESFSAHVHSITILRVRMLISRDVTSQIPNNK